MYWRHLNLTAEPFSLSPDPAFLYLSPVHAEAFAAITMGLRERRGVMTMIGEVGTGKTTLVYSLLSGLGPDFHTAYISNARLSFDGILRSALQDFDTPYSGSDRVDLLDAFNRFLHRCANEGTTAVLVVDEAQNLSYETFEDLRLLSNFETYRHKLLQIVLVGQPELDTKLRDPALRQVAERVAVRCNVNPLTHAQARQYIDHRLRAVNGSIALFTKPALRLLVSRSRGIPRSINILCHNALLFAYGEGKARVTRAVIRGAVREKQGRGLVRFDKGTRARIASGVGIAGGRWYSPARSWVAAAVLTAACGVFGLRYATSSVSLWPERAVATPETSAAAEPNSPRGANDKSRIDRRRQAALAAPRGRSEDKPAPAAAPAAPASEAKPAVAPEFALDEDPASQGPTIAKPVPAAEVVQPAVVIAPVATPPSIEPGAGAPAPAAPEAPAAAQAPVPLQAQIAHPAAMAPGTVDPATRPEAPAMSAVPALVPVPAPEFAGAAASPPTVVAPVAEPAAAPVEVPIAEPVGRIIEVPAAIDPADQALNPAAETRIAAVPAPYDTAAESAEPGPRVVTVPAGSSLSNLMLSIYGEYNAQLIDQVKAVNPQVTDPDLIIAGDRLRFPDTSNPDVPPSNRP